MTKPKDIYEYNTDPAPLAYNKEQVALYLKRIKYFNDNDSTDLPEANLDTLKRLLTKHLHSIPYGNTSNFYYNNLEEKDPYQNQPTNPNNPLITKGVSLHPLDIFRKLVIEKKDGYCYEHNLLLSDVLALLGYDNYLVGARTVNQAIFSEEKRIVMTGLRHCAIIVKIGEQKYLADVGFNSIGNFQPVPIFKEVSDDSECIKVPLPDNTELQVVRRYPPGQQHLSELVPPMYLARSLVPSYKLYEELADTKEGNELIWHPLFFFTMEPLFRADIAHINYYVVLDETCVFNEHLIVRKYTKEPRGCMARIFDNQLKIIHPDGKVDRVKLINEKGRRDALLKYFNIDLSKDKETIPPSFVNF